MQVSEEADIRRTVEELIRNARFYAETGGDDAIQLYEMPDTGTSQPLPELRSFKLTGRGEFWTEFCKRFWKGGGVLIRFHQKTKKNSGMQLYIGNFSDSETVQRRNLECCHFYMLCEQYFRDSVYIFH